MSWSLALKIADGKVEVISQTTKLPDFNVTLNGHDSENVQNIGTYFAIPKK